MTIVEPTITIPTSVSTSGILDTFETQYGALIDTLVARFSAFRTSYFPDEQNAYSAVEDWLQAAVANASAGLPQSVQDQIWGDDQARIISDKVRAQDAAVAQFAARRFPLPPDVAAAVVLQIEQKAQDALAESSRKVAMMSVELQKFNVEKLLSLRQIAMDSAAKYIQALAAGPDVASRVVGIGYDAESKFISSVAAYFSARVSAAEAANKVAIHNASLVTDVNKTEASLLIEAGKTNASLATEVSKTAASLSVDVNKAKASLGTDVSKTNASLAVDVSKTNASLSTEVEKSNSTLAVDVSKTNASLLTEASKTTASLAVDVSKANATLGTDVSKTNVGNALEVSKVNLLADVDIQKQNAALATDVSKANAAMSASAKERIGALAIEARKAVSGMALESAAKNQAAELALIDQRAKAMVEEMKVLAQLATSLLNNIHASVGLSGSNSNSNSVSYSYSNDTQTSPGPISLV